MRKSYSREHFCSNPLVFLFRCHVIKSVNTFKCNSGTRYCSPLSCLSSGLKCKLRPLNVIPWHSLAHCIHCIYRTGELELLTSTDRGGFWPGFFLH